MTSSTSRPGSAVETDGGWFELCADAATIVLPGMVPTQRTAPAGIEISDAHAEAARTCEDYGSV